MVWQDMHDRILYRACDAEDSGIHPLAPTYREQVVGVPGHALTIRDRSCAESQGKDFLAFGIESFGGLRKDARKLLDLVALEGLASGPITTYSDVPDTHPSFARYSPKTQTSPSL